MRCAVIRAQAAGLQRGRPVGAECGLLSRAHRTVVPSWLRQTMHPQGVSASGALSSAGGVWKWYSDGRHIMPWGRRYHEPRKVSRIPELVVLFNSNLCPILFLRRMVVGFLRRDLPSHTDCDRLFLQKGPRMSVVPSWNVPLNR